MDQQIVHCLSQGPVSSNRLSRSELTSQCISSLYSLHHFFGLFLSVVSSACHESQEENYKWHVGTLLQLLRTLHTCPISFEFRYCLQILHLVGIERNQEERIDHAVGIHTERYKRIDQGASCNLRESLLSFWVFVRDHNETCSFIVILVLIKNTIEMRELP